jgi:cell division protein FtsW (lipid II flippase)
MALDQFFQFLPTEGIKIVLVLFLAFLIGLEREERKASETHYSFGGVRSFPLIALIGYSIALLSKQQLLPEILGFLVVGGFLMLAYWHKVTFRKEAEMPGVTSELFGLVTYLWIGRITCG